MTNTPPNGLPPSPQGRGIEGEGEGTVQHTIATLRSLFPQLSPQDQTDLFNTVDALRIDQLQREADQYKDPELRAIAMEFVHIERQHHNARIRRELVGPLATSLPTIALEAQATVCEEQARPSEAPCASPLSGPTIEI